MNPFRPPPGTTCPLCGSEVKRAVPNYPRRETYRPPTADVGIDCGFDYLDLEPCGHLMKSVTFQKRSDVWTVTFDPLSTGATAVSDDTSPPKKYEPYVIRFSSEAALADYQTCQEILLGPPRSAEGYARSGDACDWNEDEKGQTK